jgi:hypothetical protein
VAWGNNDYGQLDVPVPNTDFVAVAADWGISFGLKADGSIVAWGHNEYGQRSVPPPNVDFVGLAAGDLHGVGLRDSATGDLNCDGVLDAFDIEPFILALFACEQYQVQYPECDCMLADVNGSGQVNAFDVEPFIDLLVGP